MYRRSVFHLMKVGNGKMVSVIFVIRAFTSFISIVIVFISCTKTLEIRCGQRGVYTCIRSFLLS